MKKLQNKIEHQFADEKLLRQALTHPSLGKANNNQRLEFLGDAVLGLVVAEMLYALFPEEQEGDLARRQAALVRGETLAKIALQLGVGEELNISSSEEAAGGRATTSNLEDALEAIIGALYIDAGLSVAKDFIQKYWQPLVAQNIAPPKDAKTALQEWAQARNLPIPVYVLLEQTGSAHSPEFTIQASINGYSPQQAKAGNKRAAEQLAAAALLNQVSS